jgi:hypothetical protein
VFLKAHWKAIAASDFFTVEVWSWRGLVTHYVLFVIDLATRRVFIGGLTMNPRAVPLQKPRGVPPSHQGDIAFDALKISARVDPAQLRQNRALYLPDSEWWAHFKHSAQSV